MGLTLTLIMAFLAGFFASTLSAGAITFLVLKEALHGKIKKSIFISLGSVTMEAIYAGIAVLSVGLFIQRSLIMDGTFIIIFKTLSIAVSLIIGFYLYFANLETIKKRKRPEAPKKEILKDYSLGFVLALFSPGIIITWIIATGIIFSFSFAQITNLLEVLWFTLVAFIGSLSGTLFLVYMVKRFREKIKKNQIRKITKGAGLLLILFSLYLLYKLLLTII